MAQAAAIVVNDRAATPVAHTFNPRAISSENAVFVENAVSPVGERKLVVSRRISGKNHKVRLLLVNPTLVNETINGVTYPKASRTAYAELNLTFSEASTLQERQDTVGLIANAMAAAQTVLNGSLTNLEGIW